MSLARATNPMLFAGTCSCAWKRAEQSRVRKRAEEKVTGLFCLLDAVDALLDLSNTEVELFFYIYIFCETKSK